ncbi:hypothetical protein OIO90_004406 [Microbotryomycetes sp. JL221]|nr:hypothetical protein OIO90_004406 [Microbotryomycetes sp. JL221]
MTNAVNDVELPPVPIRRGIARVWAHTLTQNAVVALSCFMCPGMFNALSGIGGGGQVDPTAANNGATALYSCFAVTSFFSGVILDRLGGRLTLSLGAAGYALYIGSFLSYNINANGNFVVAAGAILGVCAGLLWTAQGTLTLAYATEAAKGKYIACVWIIFNLGATIGNATMLGLTYDSSANTVSNAVYAAFLAIASCGVIVPWLLVNPAKMVRTDGTRVIIPQQTSWKESTVGLFHFLRTHLWIVLLFPFFLASNWFYTWQFNSFNGVLFTLRTRSLNSMLYWMSQMVAALLFGIAIDTKRIRRVTRAWSGLIFLLVLSMAVWGASYHYQTSYTRADMAEPRAPEFARIDFKDSGYAGRLILFLFCGAMDAIWQNYAYWLMGALSNDAQKLGHLVGAYKAIQSAGAAGVYRLDTNLAPFMLELGVSWGLCAGSLLFVMPIIWFHVKDKTKDEPVVMASDDVVVHGEKAGSNSASSFEEKV